MGDKKKGDKGEDMQHFQNPLFGALASKGAPAAGGGSASPGSSSTDSIRLSHKDQALLKQIKKGEDTRTAAPTPGSNGDEKPMVAAHHVHRGHKRVASVGQLDRSAANTVHQRVPSQGSEKAQGHQRVSSRDAGGDS